MTKIPPMPEELRFDHEAHVRLWNWLAENPGKNKDDWPEWETRALAPEYCFACAADRALYWYIMANGLPMPQMITYETPCICPLTWPNILCTNLDGTGLYTAWVQETNPVDSARLARQIRDLPVNDNLERAWREIQETLRRNTPGAEGGDAHAAG